MAFHEFVLQPWVYGPLAAIATVSALFFIKGRLFALARRLAARTATRMDDLFLGVAGRPLNLLIIASGLLLLGRILPLEAEADQAIVLLYKACVVGAVVWFTDRLSRGLLDLCAERVVFVAQARGVIQGLARGLFVALGALVLLDSLGISITPLLASLGVGSLAVALALQGTLANLFAGIHLLADKAIEPGHFIKLESGEDGFVERIGWRSTRVRMLPNIMLVVPNSKLVESVITNYSLPDAQTAVLVNVGVHYDSDLGRVEQVTIDVAREVMRKVAGAVRDFEPFIRYNQFGDSSINFTVIMRGMTRTDQYLIMHEFVKRLHERYRREGIVIPFPMRTLDIPDRVLERMAAAS